MRMGAGETVFLNAVARLIVLQREGRWQGMLGWALEDTEIM